MIKSNFDLAQLYSNGAAADDLVREFTPSNPNSRDKRYGMDTTIAVTVKSVSFLKSHDGHGPPFDRGKAAKHNAA